MSVAFKWIDVVRLANPLDLYSDHLLLTAAQCES